MSMILVVGLAGPGTPLGLIEATSVSAEQLPKALHALTSAEHVREAVLVSTCLRTEAYVVVDRYHAAAADVRRFLAEWSRVSEDDISSNLFAYEGDQAVSHLFRLACGLESAALGESEILGQLRAAAEAAVAEGAAGTTLDRLFRAARGAGRRARVATAIGRGATSLAHAAVALATSRVEADLLSDVLIIGAGEVATDAARAARTSVPHAGLTVVSRSPERAGALADAVGASLTTPEMLPDAIGRADLVLACTSASEPVLTAELVATALRGRRERPLLLIDLGVPRDVDPAVADLAGATLLDMDNIAAFAASVADSRRREIPKVEALIAERIAAYEAEVSARAVAPLLAALHARAEAVRLGELERHRRLLADLSDAQREAVDSLTQALVAKLLHRPSVEIRSSATSAEGPRMAEAVRRLYDL